MIFLLIDLYFVQATVMRTLFTKFQPFKVALFLILLFCVSLPHHNKVSAQENYTPILLDKSSSSSLQQVLTPITVKTVVNPMTFTDTKGNAYRLASLESPVISARRIDKEFSKASITFAKQLLEGQKLILYDFKDKKASKVNRYNQRLVHAVRQSDDSWIQAAFLSNGMARVDTMPNGENPVFADILKNLEYTAYQNKTGLWALEGYAYQNANEPDSIGEGFQIMRGTLKKVSLHKNTLYLNFGNNWKTDFSASMDTKTRKALAKAGFNPMNWSNTEIEIRGFVRNYNGPFVDISHAGQIQLLNKNDTVINEP